MITFNLHPSLQLISDKTSLGCGHSMAEGVAFHLNPPSSTLQHLQWRLLYKALPRTGLTSWHLCPAYFLLPFVTPGPQRWTPWSLRPCCSVGQVFVGTRLAVWSLLLGILPANLNAPAAVCHFRQEQIPQPAHYINLPRPVSQLLPRMWERMESPSWTF